MASHTAVLWVLLCAVVTVIEGNIDDALWKYETLHHTQLRHHIVKRDVTSNTPHVRQVQFESLGRRYHLYLQKKRDLLSPGFRVVTINAENEERDLSLDDVSPYDGHVVGEEDSSKVHAVWEDEDNMAATIITHNDTVFIEPSWRHLPENENFTMIIYRKSDVKSTDSGEKFCGFVNATEDFGLPEPPPPENKEHVRKRREEEGFSYAPVHTTCQLLLTADYLFYTNMGRSSPSRVTSYLIGLIDRVDATYRKTDFGNGNKGMGFEIKEIRIHDEFNKRGDQDPPHYNVKWDGPWPTKTLLESFSRDRTLGKFCLAHLFTYQPFDGGVLGLAYIGSPRTYSLGGICSPDYYKKGGRLYLNTGWSSGLNHHKRRLLTQEADLVTTHGHNWGSEHDPDNKECAPSAFGGGKYIMYMYSVSGYDTNNKVFSPCSRRSIGAVLEKKANGCFSTKRKSFCGNSLVEAPEEECDVGPGGQKGTDPCCDKNCRFKPTAKCSDKNEICCKNCQFAASTILCHESSDDHSTCRGEAYCTGKNGSCPTPNSKPDGSKCLERGSCRNGKCVPFCEERGLVSCICDTVESSCMWCCKKNSNSSCVAYSDGGSNHTALPDGMPCIWGSCNQGVCVKETKELVQRFWSIIENITPDRIGRFMRDNLVGCVIILSLIVWIPVSCIIGWQDRKARNQENKRPPEDEFYQKGQAERVRKPQRTFVRPSGDY